MRRLLAVVLALGLGWFGQAGAQERATKAEAVELVKKAVALIKEVGKEKALAEFNNPKGAFVDRDLYIVAADMNGIVLAHGANQRLLGKDTSELKDADGKSFVKDQVKVVTTTGNGWIEFKFTNPVSKKVEPRHMFVQKIDNDWYIGAGVFMP